MCFFFFKLSTRKNPLTETKMKLRLDESLLIHWRVVTMDNSHHLHLNLFNGQLIPRIGLGTWQVNPTQGIGFHFDSCYCFDYRCTTTTTNYLLVNSVPQTKSRKPLTPLWRLDIGTSIRLTCIKTRRQSAKLFKNGSTAGNLSAKSYS